MKWIPYCLREQFNHPIQPNLKLATLKAAKLFCCRKAFINQINKITSMRFCLGISF